MPVLPVIAMVHVVSSVVMPENKANNFGLALAGSARSRTDWNCC